MAEEIVEVNIVEKEVIGSPKTPNKDTNTGQRAMLTFSAGYANLFSNLPFSVQQVLLPVQQLYYPVQQVMLLCLAGYANLFSWLWFPVQQAQ